MRMFENCLLMFCEATDHVYVSKPLTFSWPESVLPVNTSV